MNMQRGACKQADRKLRISTLKPDMDNASVGIVIKESKGVSKRIRLFS